MERPRKLVPPFWLVLGLGLAFLLNRHFPLWVLPWPWLGLAGRLLVVAGLSMVLWPVGQFIAARTGLVPFTEATVLVTGGLYRLSRNPMYLGMAFVLLGGGLIAGSVGALLPLPLFLVIIQKHFIEGEERFLAEAFGDDYRAYRQRVRRWV